MSDLREPPFEQADRPPARARCGRHQPGHTPDLIRVRLAQMSPAEDWQRVVVLDVRGDVVTLALGDDLGEYRSHDAALLSALLADHGPVAMLNAGYHLLFLAPRADGSSPVFSLQPADQSAEPCSTERTAERPAGT